MRKEDGAALAAVLLGLGSAAFTASQIRDLMRTRVRVTADECAALTTSGGVLRGVRYLERMRGGAEPDAEVPMVVLFHSKGATAEGHAGMLAGLEPCRLIVPEGVLSTSGGGRLWWEKGVIAAMEQPEAAAVQWRVAAARIIVFLRALVQCRPTVGSPIVTGSSMGAEMAYLMATLYPREVYGAVAVNGYLIPPLWSPDMAPTLSLHGTSDRTVPYDWDAEYVAAMAERGAPIRMESFDAGHAITTAMSRAWSAAVDRLIQGVASGADASLVL